MAGSSKLEGRMALVAGGSRGIDAAIALAFAAEGADVAFCHNDDDEGAVGVEAAVRAQGRRAFSWRCDLSDMEAARRLFADAETALGQVDILVNNAGVSEEKAVEAITLEAVEWMMNVHFKATFVLSQLAYIRMKPRGYGRIINVSSNLAYKGAPGLAHYSAAKAAVLGFTRSMAQEAAPHGVLVNAIAPGPIDTRLNDTLSPSGRPGRSAACPLSGSGGPKKSLLPQSCWLLQTAVSMSGRRCTRTAATSCPDLAHGKGLWSGSSDRANIACTPLLPSTV